MISHTLVVAILSFTCIPFNIASAGVVIDSEAAEITKIEDSIVYPHSERRANRNGRVVLMALLDTNGVVEKIECKSATNRAFQDAAEEAVQKTRFTPAVSNGRHVRIWITRTINFKMAGPHYEEHEEDNSDDGGWGLG